MGLINELRARGRHAIGALLAILAVVYFTYHLLNGDRGLIAWWQVRQNIDTSRLVLDDLARRRQVLEQRVQGLRADSLDPDLLDERSRIMLNYGLPGETTILVDPADR